MSTLTGSCSQAHSQNVQTTKEVASPVQWFVEEVSHHFQQPGHKMVWPHITGGGNGLGVPLL